MAFQHRVMILNKPLRVYGFTLPQLVFVLATFIAAFMVARYCPRFPLVGSMPLSFFCGIFTVSIGVGLAQATNIRPMHWWLKQLQFFTRPSLPLYLPDVNIVPGIDGDGCVMILHNGRRKICYKTQGMDILKLDHLQREDLSSIFTSALSGCPTVQIVHGTAIETGLPSCFYLIVDEPAERSKASDLLETSDDSASESSPSTALVPAPRSYASPILKLREAGIDLTVVGEEELRKLLFAHLSPSHFARGELIPPVRENFSDTLTLCKTGFIQHRNCLEIDEKFCTVMKVTNLPLETYVGWLRNLVSRDGSFNTSFHFSYCNQRAVREQVRYDLRMTSATRTSASALVEPSADLNRFIQGGLSAFDFSCYISVFGDSMDELSQAVVSARESASSCGVVLELADLEQLDGFISSLPIGHDRLKAVQRILSPVAGTCWPFVVSSDR